MAVQVRKSFIQLQGSTVIHLQPSCVFHLYLYTTIRVIPPKKKKQKKNNSPIWKPTKESRISISFPILFVTRSHHKSTGCIPKVPWASAAWHRHASLPWALRNGSRSPAIHGPKFLEALGHASRIQRCRRRPPSGNRVMKGDDGKFQKQGANE